MHTKSLVFSTCLILLWLLLISIGGKAEEYRSVKSGDWSDPTTWGKTVNIPTHADDVVIDSSHIVIYDVGMSPDIKTIHVRGKLEFSREKDTELSVCMIVVSPAVSVDFNADCSRMSMHIGSSTLSWLEVGSWDDPIRHPYKAEINLVYFPDMNSDCAPGILSYGGRIDFHGDPIRYPFVKATEGVEAGDLDIIVGKDVGDWRPLDRIVLTSSTAPGTNFHNDGSFRTNGLQRSEELVIEQLHDVGEAPSMRIDLTGLVQNEHPIRVTDYETYAPEVANLSRNVVVRTRDLDGPWGHTMYHHGSRGSMSYTRFDNLGKSGILARYPVHYHLVGSTMRGSSLIGNVFYDSGNRWVTIHGADYIVVKDNVGFKSEGHGYYLEDGSEQYNLFYRNLAVLAYDADRLPNQAIDYDLNEGAGFWAANWYNAFIGNVVAECDQYGYNIDVKDGLVMDVRNDEGGVDAAVEIATLPTLRFSYNEAHSNMKYGLFGVANTDGDNPIFIDNLKLWSLWYAFSPELRTGFYTGVNIFDTAYGFYGQEAKDHHLENFVFHNTGNYGLGYIARPEGLMLIEDGVIHQDNNDYWGRVSGRKERDREAHIHIRGLTTVNFSKALETHTGVTLTPNVVTYLHDWNGPGLDEIVVHESRLSIQSDTLDFSSDSEHHNSLRSTPARVPWPSNGMDLSDRRGPYTTILYPADGDVFPEGVGRVIVYGSVVDNNTYAEVSVNGVPADIIFNEDIPGSNFWTITIDNFDSGPLVIESVGTDGAFNQELNPHRITVTMGGEGSGDTALPPKNLEVKK